MGMLVEQKKWTHDGGWKTLSDQKLSEKAQLVLVFGATAMVKDPDRYSEIAAWYPKAHVILASTAGEILGERVSDNSLVLTAISFTKTSVICQKAQIAMATGSHDVGINLAKALPPDGLVHVLVFSEGLLINGTRLVAGLHEALPGSVSVTGGLVGDGANFKETAVGLDGPAASGTIVVIGLYGSDLRVGYGSLGGWDPFGPERIITKSKDNILYELDEKPALTIYKEYLGEQAKELPGSGLLFPLSLRMPGPNGADVHVVRTILAVNEEDQSMTFAGDMPMGVAATMMKANFDRLIDGAGQAASKSVESAGAATAELAILISCIGRKLVLKERIEEEIEAVREAVGKHAATTGFYSYGELCPTAATEKQCQLHNQTMTITTLREV